MQIDFEFGLSQLSGNEALLIKLLSKIRVEYADCEARLQAMFANEQWEDAKVLVHTLKGVSGNLGCVALHQATKIVDNELKHDTGIPSSINRLYTTLNETLNKIAEVEQTGSIASTNQSVPTECGAEAAKNDLVSLLNDNAFIAPDVFSEKLSALELEDSKKTALEQYINTLDYQRALELLNT